MSLQKVFKKIFYSSWSKNSTSATHRKSWHFRK